ncbi:MAG: AAA family ATPase [Acidimicrobiia bacterium]|nr:AAA family ATPase [Acidimicrobiia bacterium]
MSGLPTGTITFLFTDIEGSTRLVQALEERWPAVITDHDALLRSAIEANGGIVVRTEGDAFFAVFASAVDAVAAAVEGQRSVAAHRWPEDGQIRVRMGLHTGVGALGGGDYVGIDVHRAARVAAAGHGGQIVISEATAPLVEWSLPEGAELLDLGKHRLKDLAGAETLFQVSVAGLPDAFGPLHTLERVSHNLPVQVTSFVGREREIAEALRLLDDSRILTLLGPGGIGKTRLALQVAAEAAERFPDGVYFVGLSEVADAALIPSTILTSLGAAPAAGMRSPAERVGELLADRSVLLVLDNFEHLMSGAAGVADLARLSPGSKFLITSRVPLRVSGEQEFPIAPLGLAGEIDVTDPEALARVEAVRLFLERAAAVRPGFALTRENAASIATLVTRLDGLPLAIELVAPQLRLLSVDRIVARLDPLHLGGGGRDLPERQRTLAKAIAWSEESLTPHDRNLFCLLAAFSGGRLDEIEAVVRACDPESDVVAGLAALVEASLVRRSERHEDRFEMLSVIREFAGERLDESGKRAVVEAAHARAYLELAEAAATHLLGRERKRWLDVLTADHENLRAALTHLATTSGTDEALRLVAALWRFWQIKGHTYEARQRIDAVLALPGGSPHLRAKALEASGGIAWWQGDLPRASREYTEVLEMQRQLDDPAELANALYNCGIASAFAVKRGGEEGAASDSDAMLREAERIYGELGHQRGLGDVHWGMGNVALFGRDDPATALGFFEAAVGEYAAGGSTFGEGWSHFEKGQALLRLGQTDEATTALNRGLRLLYESGDESAVVLFVIMIAAVELAQGNRHRAFRLAGSAWALRDRSGLDIISIPENTTAGLERATLEALSGPDGEAYRQGLLLSTQEAVALALDDTPGPGDQGS